VKGKEFIDRAATWAKRHDVAWRVEASRGKGGHKLLYVGERRTTVQTGEIPPGTLHAMLRQLAIPKAEF
jgi:hypothetical protein